MLSDWNSTRNVNIASVQDMYACVPICVCVCVLLLDPSIHLECMCWKVKPVGD
jgi:hypothetical protein